jgi:hypothetical protein
VWVYPRPIDLENVDKLATFRDTKVVLSMEALRAALDERLQCLSTSSS